MPRLVVLGETLPLGCRLVRDGVVPLMTTKQEKSQSQKAHRSEKGCLFLHVGQYMPADCKCVGTLCLPIACGQKMILHQ